MTRTFRPSSLFTLQERPTSSLANYHREYSPGAGGGGGGGGGAEGQGLSEVGAVESWGWGGQALKNEGPASSGKAGNRGSFDWG
jgi:hypothetical protein